MLFPLRFPRASAPSWKTGRANPKPRPVTTDRARIVLWAAEGFPNDEIARRLDTRPARVSKWRIRFDQERLAGLSDDFRPGRMPVYDAQSRQRLLKNLDEAPPKGFSNWTGPLLAAALGDMSVHQVWRELRALGISLARRRSWCVSADQEFEPKAAGIVALYLQPADNAVVISVNRSHTRSSLARFFQCV